MDLTQLKYHSDMCFVCRALFALNWFFFFQLILFVPESVCVFFSPSSSGIWFRAIDVLHGFSVEFLIPLQSFRNGSLLEIGHLTPKLIKNRRFFHFLFKFHFRLESGRFLFFCCSHSIFARFGFLFIFSCNFKPCKS